MHHTGYRFRNLCLSVNSLFRHAGLDPASRKCLKGWIPAFAGMTILIERAIYKRTLINPSPIEGGGGWSSSHVFSKQFFSPAKYGIKPVCQNKHLRRIVDELFQ
jgi:hypothetical protein